MRAVKENKEYAVTEENQSFYVAQGFDILDHDGNVIEYGKGKKVDYAKYRKLKETNEKLMAEIKRLKKELKETAQKNGDSK